MTQENLSVFVAEKARSGITPDEIRKQLLTVGWADDEIDAALFAGFVAAGVPAPERSERLVLGSVRKASAVEVALNLFSFVLLGINATAVGILYYQIINRYFPDPLEIGYRSASSIETSVIHYAIAALVVGFPLYYLSMKLWFRRFREDDRKVASTLTKILTYLVLLIASVTIVGDLITSVFYFLEGEMSIRFFLKAGIVFAIAGTVFGFYYLERQTVQFRREISRKVFQYFGLGVGIFILAGIVLGFVAGGSPREARLRGLDDQRASDLRSLSQCVKNYAQSFEKLPETLADLETTSGTTGNYYYGCNGNTVDPETGLLYDYRIVVPSRTAGSVIEGEFELCAAFSLASDAYEQRDLNVSDKWSKHSAGKECDREKVVLKKLNAVEKNTVGENNLPD